MKNVNFLLSILFIYFICSCGRDDEPIEYPAPCVTPDIITDTTSGFMIYDKGKQEHGFAKGIKINQLYESSVTLNMFGDSLLSIRLQSAKLNERGWMLETENLSVYNVAKYFDVGCFPITHSGLSKDSYYVTYSIDDYDINNVSYKLDMSADNVFEIISYEPESKKLKARLKASFIAEKEYLPDNPKNVRFSDVYIEHGY